VKVSLRNRIAFYYLAAAGFLVALIFLNLILGVAAALRTGTFDWVELANWFRGMVMPYLIGYLGLVVVVNVLLPPGAISDPAIVETGLVEWLNVAAVNFAWLTLVGSLANRITRNGRQLYGGA